MSRRQQRYDATHSKDDDNDSQDEESVEYTAKNSNVMPFQTDNSIDPGRILHSFRSMFQNLLESPTLKDHIQVVKKFLYNREYLQAFDNDDKRFAYAARWTPARSLSYASLFGSLPPLTDLFKDPDTKVKALCIGGGASAEVVGLAAVYCRLKECNSASDSDLTINVVDIADWHNIVGHVTKYVKSQWLYDESKFSTNFINEDILTASSATLQLNSLDVITLLFTTNELFAVKRKQTIDLFHLLSQSCKQGALLLIAESAGSYSNITIGSKQFPVQFLIDMVLVGKPGQDDGAWEIIEQSDSCWYRIEPREISYPLKLENMRYFYRLYRKK